MAEHRARAARRRLRGKRKDGRLTRRELTVLLAREMLHSHKLECEGAFSLERDPFDLMPAIDAYADEDISGGKMRECIRRWLAGESFREPKNREWEETSRG